MSYRILDVTPDTPEWFEKRREGLGASDTAAVLGLSKWATPLSVYQSKMGVDHDFDPMRAWVGHNQEPVIAQWVIEFHSEVGKLLPGFAAQSVEWPWLFATPDRVADDVGLLIPVELKTSMEFARDSWVHPQTGAPAVPLYYQTQLQQQMAVLGSPYGWMVVFHGGRDFEIFKVPRDQVFITEHLVPKTEAFWRVNVLAKIAPAPSTHGEAVEAFPGEEGLELELTQEQYDNLVQRDVDASDMNHTKKRVEAFKDYIGPIIGDATVLTFNGEALWSYKRQNGAPSISDAQRLKEEWPDAWDACVTVPRFPVLRRLARKDK